MDQAVSSLTSPGAKLETQRCRSASRYRWGTAKSRAPALVSPPPPSEPREPAVFFTSVASGTTSRAGPDGCGPTRQEGGPEGRAARRPPRQGREAPRSPSRQGARPAGEGAAGETSRPLSGAAGHTGALPAPDNSSPLSPRLLAPAASPRRRPRRKKFPGERFVVSPRAPLPRRALLPPPRRGGRTAIPYPPTPGLPAAPAPPFAGGVPSPAAPGSTPLAEPVNFRPPAPSSRSRHGPPSPPVLTLTLDGRCGGRRASVGSRSGGGRARWWGLGALQQHRGARPACLASPRLRRLRAGSGSAPWAGGVSGGGRVTAGSAAGRAGRFPARGVEAPPRGRGESPRTQTAGHAVTPRCPPCLPGTDGLAQTLIIPSSEGRGGEGSGAATAPLTNLPFQLLLPARVRQRRAPDARPRSAPLPLPSRPPRPTCGGGSKTTATPSAQGEGREVLALGRCRRAGFAGGGWERERGGAEPGGGSAALPPRGCPRRAPSRRGGGDQTKGRGAGWRAWGRGVGPPPPRLGSSPASAAGTAGCLRPVPGCFFMAAIRPSCLGALLRGAALRGRARGRRGAALPAPLGGGGSPGAARPPALPGFAAGTGRGQVSPLAQSSPLRAPIAAGGAGAAGACRPVRGAAGGGPARLGSARPSPTSPGDARGHAVAAREAGFDPSCACCLRQSVRRGVLHVQRVGRELLISIPADRPKAFTRRNAFLKKKYPVL
ncbi:uncharacterized protein LJ264_006494 [Porphyrio hochstetteri]